MFTIVLHQPLYSQTPPAVWGLLVRMFSMGDKSGQHVNKFSTQTLWQGHAAMEAALAMSTLKSAASELRTDNNLGGLMCLQSWGCSIHDLQKEC